MSISTVIIHLKNHIQKFIQVVKLVMQYNFLNLSYKIIYYRRFTMEIISTQVYFIKFRVVLFMSSGDFAGFGGFFWVFIKCYVNSKTFKLTRKFR